MISGIQYSLKYVSLFLDTSVERIRAAFIEYFNQCEMYGC